MLFRADGTLAILKRVAEETPRPIAAIIPEVPPWLRDVIARLHAKDPADRIGTAREVADLLERGPAETPRPVATPRPTPLTSLPPLDVRGTVTRAFSPEGTLVVAVDDPGVGLRIDGADLVITGARATGIRLKPGDYTVDARKGGRVVSWGLAAVTRNGRQVVRVSQEPTPAEARTPAAPFVHPTSSGFWPWPPAAQAEAVRQARVSESTS